jgi:hypothetical protein
MEMAYLLPRHDENPGSFITTELLQEHVEAEEKILSITGPRHGLEKHLHVHGL